MQTFLPEADFAESMRILDPSRLGNQVYREGMTLIRGKWPNHPACKMWVGYSQALAVYLLFGVRELLARGQDHTAKPWCDELLKHVGCTNWKHFDNNSSHIYRRVDMPPWFGDDRIHSSHRAALLWKDYDHYRQFGWKERPTGPSPVTHKFQYVWPSDLEEYQT